VNGYTADIPLLLESSDLLTVTSQVINSEKSDIALLERAYSIAYGVVHSSFESVSSPLTLLDMLSQGINEDSLPEIRENFVPLIEEMCKSSASFREAVTSHILTFNLIQILKDYKFPTTDEEEHRIVSKALGALGELVSYCKEEDNLEDKLIYGGILHPLLSMLESPLHSPLPLVFWILGNLVRYDTAHEIIDFEEGKLLSATLEAGTLEIKASTAQEANLFVFKLIEGSLPMELMGLDSEFPIIRAFRPLKGVDGEYCAKRLQALEKLEGAVVDFKERYGDIIADLEADEDMH